MLKSYLKLALRNLLRHKGYSLINILGLAIGLACCIVILIHMMDELSYDRFHDKVDRVYRVNRDWQRPDTGHNPRANTPPAFGPALLMEYPAIEKFTRILFPYPQSVLISHGDSRFYEDGFYWADSTFFSIFSFPLKQGNPRTALTEVNSVVLTEKMARKYFGASDPIGKTLTIEGWTRDDYKVTGILQDLPENSHLQFDFLGSIRGADERYSYLFSGEGKWVNSLVYTYVLLRPGTSAQDLNALLPDFGERHLGEFARERGFIPGLELQPLSDIYLNPGPGNQPRPVSDITYVYIFAAIAVLILIIACINYMNLATARSARRAREVGMRKVLGAQRKSLVRQFLGDSMLTSFAALLLSLGLVELMLPIFNDISGKNLSFSYPEHPVMLLAIVAITCLVGLTAGSYPAFVLSAFRPVAILKGELFTRPSVPSLRRGLIVLQFVTSITLIIATGVVMKQLSFVRNQPLGFSKEHVVVIPIRDDDMRDHTKIAKQQFLRNRNVMSVSAAAGVPGRDMLIDGFPVRPAGADRALQIPMQIVGLDYDYFQTLDIELVEGRNFQKTMATDSAAAFVINESAARALGWTEPVGKHIELVMENGKQGTIIGVVRDFHFESLHETVEPAVFHIWPQRYSCFAVKVQAEALPETLRFLETTWRTLRPDQPFEYFFLDQEFDRQYRKDERIGQIFGYAAGLAILVACLGLFGLASFTTQQRTQEIGIRKVLGGSVAHIVGLLSRDFIRLLLYANLIAWPVAWWAMQGWLGSFAYRTEMSWWLFGLAGGLALVIAMLTVSSQAIRAAMANPVDALHYE